jgi:hypothetical protein
MGFFDKLFGKKEEKNTSQAETQTVHVEKGAVFVSTGDDISYKVSRHLTDEQRQRINDSTISLMATQLYMHYWTDNLISEDQNDQNWLNQAVFFWKAEEPFPKKSLPPEFDTFKTKHFVFVASKPNITLRVGEVMPWFGMPGYGKKHFCERDGQMITISELNKLGIIEYVELIELSSENLDVLTNRDDYFVLIDNRITPYQNGNFNLNGKPVPMDVAYSIGGIHIVKKANLE